MDVVIYRNYFAPRLASLSICELSDLCYNGISNFVCQLYDLADVFGCQVQITYQKVLNISRVQKIYFD